jgi:hypothetical protein
VFVYASNPDALHVWDALADTETLVREKIGTMKLTRVNTAAEAALKVYILNREPSIGLKILNRNLSPENCPAVAAGKPPIDCRISNGASCIAGTDAKFGNAQSMDCVLSPLFPATGSDVINRITLQSASN